MLSELILLKCSKNIISCNLNKFDIALVRKGFKNLNCFRGYQAQERLAQGGIYLGSATDSKIRVWSFLALIQQ